MSSATDNTIALNYRETGTGQPVFLLHGMFGSLSNLGLVGRALSDSYRVIAVDLRNHGESPHSNAMDYPLMAEDVVRLMDQLQIQQAHLIGHSMGGKIAMQIALTQPQRIGKLVVADIAPVDYQVDRHDGILDGLSALHQQPPASRRDADKILSQFIEVEGVRAFLLKNLIRDTSAPDKQIRFRLKLNLDGILANYATQLTRAPSGTPFSAATLFLKGSDSNYIQEQHRETILRLFPNTSLKIIDNTSHWLHAEKPEIFNRLVRQFLDN